MTVAFEISKEQANQIEDARLSGISVDNLFDRFLETLPDFPKREEPKITDQNRALIALLQNWSQEDAELPTEGDSKLKNEGEKFSADLLANRVDFSNKGLTN